MPSNVTFDHKHVSPRKLVSATTLLLCVVGMMNTAQSAIITVGAGGSYDFASVSSAINSAQANDTIRVQAGLYQNDFSTINVPLTIEGDGGLATLEATVPISNGKAIFVTNANVTLRNLEFRGASVNDQNGAGIRGQSGDIIVENSIFRDNENGILVGNSATMNVTISDSQFIDNGFGNGFTHGIYVNRIAGLTVQDSVFEGTRVGHDIKSRAAVTNVFGNVLDDGFSGTRSYAIDASNGGKVTISGNTIRQGANTSNPTMIAFGAEGNLYLDSMLGVSNNAFINSRPGNSIGVFNHTTVFAQLDNNTFDGVVIPLLGPGQITDTPPVGVPQPGMGGLMAMAFFGLLSRRVLCRRAG